MRKTSEHFELKSGDVRVYVTKNYNEKGVASYEFMVNVHSNYIHLSNKQELYNLMTLLDEAYEDTGLTQK